MISAKWFANLTASTPVIQAARFVLEARAHTVLHFLTIVVKNRAEDPEDIHQLRVATRRLAAALSIFRDCLRSSDYRRLRRITRKLRRAAGAVRDLDVHRDLIASRLRAVGPRGATLGEWCDRSLLRQRRPIKQRLLKVAQGAARDFSEAVTRGLARLKPVPCDGEAAVDGLLPVARKIVRRRLKELRAAGRDDLHDLNNLHRLRIAAKRLRYSMEVFAGCFPIPFRRQYYRAVERNQEDLGRINDLRTVAQTIEDFCSAPRLERPDRSPGAPAMTIEQLQARLRSELKVCKRRFVARWDQAAQRQFHQRVKDLLNRAAVQSRIQVARISEL